MSGRKTPPFDKVSERLNYSLRFKKLANAIHSAPDFRAVLIGLREEILHLHEAQMVTIYLADLHRKEIYSLSMAPDNSLEEIRLPISSTSIAGHVARTGKPANIRNVYDPAELLSIDPDLAFNASWDKKTGVRTRQVLALPVLFENSLLGVIQLMNKQGGARFTIEDEKCLYDLAETLGIAFHNLAKSAQKHLPSRYDPLIASGTISEQELAEAREFARRRHKDIETILLHELKVSRQELGSSLARFYKTVFVDLRRADYNPAELIKGINIEYFRKTRCVPLARKDGTVLFAIDDPHDQVRTQEIMQVLRTAKAEFHVALREDIAYFLGRIGSLTSGQRGWTQEMSMTEIVAEMQKEARSGPPSGDGDLSEPPADDRAIVMLVRKIVENAFRQRASDIHFEPYGHKQDAVVRFRIDGRCARVLTIPSSHIRSVISRLKIMARLDIAERRRPQDGKIGFRVASGREIELRVCVIPTADGNEDIVLRLLATSEPLPLDKLMQPELCRRFKEVISRPHGLILVVGPTGSGKTTTLHAALGLLNSADRKILTAEDPVEISQHGLRQVQVNPKIGLSFVAAMRAFLRADPDVIMVGEMRDRETAAIAIEASLTGHLVLSTLHTNSAPETIIRLKDMGMDPFNFADSLLCVLAQRLVRTLCRKCKTAYLPARNEYDHLAKTYGAGFEENTGITYSEGLRLYRAAGCGSCNNGGYWGRSGLYELLLASRPIKGLIVERARLEAIRELAIAEGMTTLLQDGIRKVFAGHTEFSQIMSVCGQ